MRKLKLIWDFRGPDSEKTAEHHIIHLKEYLAAENIPYIETGTGKPSDIHAIAYVAIDEVYMKKIRDDLKPHRGQLFV